MTGLDATEKLRLFVAVPVPVPVGGVLERVRCELHPLVPPEAVRWVAPEQYHLTLKFLGDLPAGTLEDLKAELGEACGRSRRFHLQVRGLGFFPNGRSPRVIWAGIQCGDPSLAELQAQVAQAVAAFVKPPAAEKFLGHVTLGRFQKYRQYKTRKLLAGVAAFEGRVFGDWPVAGADLYCSQWSPKGARHVRLASFPLMTG